MFNLIRSFFYSVALLTLFWVTQQPADQVTLANWARAVQSEHLQQASYIITLVICVVDQALFGIMAWPSRTTHTISVSQAPRGGRVFEAPATEIKLDN